MRIFSILALQLTLTTFAFCQKPKLYVFLPSNIRPFSMEKTFSAACDQLSVQVFGRSRDLRKSVDSLPPDAILTPSAVATSGVFNDFRQILSGSRGDATEEDYVLVSVNQPIQLADVPELAIGAVDLLGRRQMELFVSKSLGDRVPRKIEPVTKLEDLLTILQFQDVDAIFVPKYLVDSFYRKRSKMNLVITELPQKVPLPVLSIKSDDPDKLAKLEACLKNMSSQVNIKLGVDTWVKQP